MKPSKIIELMTKMNDEEVEKISLYAKKELEYRNKLDEYEKAYIKRLTLKSGLKETEVKEFYLTLKEIRAKG